MFEGNRMRPACARLIQLTLCGSAVLLTQAGAVRAFDIFNTEAQISPGPATPLMHEGDDPCRQGPPPEPVSLLAAIEIALCESPQTRTAWASVKAAAASVGESKAAYLPTLDGTASYEASHVQQGVTHDAKLQSSYSQPTNSEALSMSWLLFDFGGRRAALKSSKQLLAAAQANQIAVLQTVLSATAKDYYAAQAAAAAASAARRIEAVTQETLQAASARYKTGVAPITDQLAASTAASQATYQRTRAEGQFQVFVGGLATDMGLPPDQALMLPTLDQSVLPDTNFVQAVHDLIDAAVQSHPTVLAARAHLQSSLEEVRVARSLGYPKLSLAGTVSRDDAPLSESLGQPEYPAVSKQAAIGLSVQIPLFEGFKIQYGVRQAQAQAETDSQAVVQAEQQVANGVWTSFQMLQTATENLRNTQVVLQSARDSFDASESRYKAGVGAIIELLNTQTQLAGAEQQQIQAQFDWRTARIMLAQSLGQLGLWAVQ